MSLPHSDALAPIAFDLPEAAALMSRLAAVGLSASPSATFAMRKLGAALQSR